VARRGRVRYVDGSEFIVIYSAGGPETKVNGNGKVLRLVAATLSSVPNASPAGKVSPSIDPPLFYHNPRLSLLSINVHGLLQSSIPVQ
jgi:hypothetical protein